MLEKKLSILRRAMKELPNNIFIVSAYVGTFEELNELRLSLSLLKLHLSLSLSLCVCVSLSVCRCLFVCLFCVRIKRAAPSRTYTETSRRKRNGS